MKPFISTGFYGVLNYIIALTLIAAPWLFNLIDITHVSSAAIFIPMYIGWLQLIMAIFADNAASPIQKFPMEMHLTLDVVMGFFLAVSPWLYNFASKIFWPELLFGGILFFLGIFTHKSPFTTTRHPSLSKGGFTSTDSI